MITGKMFRDGIISASNNIANSRQAVDALNIFPVPDGDTGTNMSMTIGAAAKEMAVLADDCTIGEASARCASALYEEHEETAALFFLLYSEAFQKHSRGLMKQTERQLQRRFQKVLRQHTRLL